MQIVIDIPEELYEILVQYRDLSTSILEKSVADGTVLPKGHGDLIDVDEIIWDSADFDTYSDYSLAFDTLDYAPTIIEADKEETAWKCSY